MTMGERLKEERLRLALSQTALAERCGVTKNTQLAYEKGERSPDGAYFAVAVTLGVDLLYVVTGERMPQSGAGISGMEGELLGHFRQLPLIEQAGVLRTVSALAATLVR